jgi:hypothetical protein
LMGVPKSVLVDGETESVYDCGHLP